MTNLFGQEVETPKITEIVKNNTARFDHFRNGEFAYRINVKGVPYQFTLTPEDVKGGILLAEDRAIIFMKFINRALKENTFQRVI